MTTPSIVSSKLAVVAVAVASAAATAVAPSTASAASKVRSSCDRLGGQTLAANERVRLFRTTLGKSEVHFRACSYRSNRVKELWFDDPDVRVRGQKRSFTWGINGDFVALSVSTSGSSEPTDRAAGEARERLYLWNGRTRRSYYPGNGLVGLRFSELVVTPSGTVAAIGNPYGVVTRPDGSSAPLTESQIEVYKPGSPSTSTWETVAKGSANGLRDLALSGDRLIWTDPAGLQQAPLA